MAGDAQAPSVKGSIFLIPVQGVKALLRSGELSREEAESRLLAEDLCFLDDKILLGGWYPVAAFNRLAALTEDTLAEGHAGTFYADQGAAAAERLLESELYRDFAKVADRRGDKAGPSMLTMAQLIFNFSHWTLRNESDSLAHFEIELTDAAPMPEGLRLAVLGFIRAVAERLVGEPIEVVSARPSADVIVYRGRPL